MKVNHKGFIFFTILSLIMLSSCKNVKIEEDYYYTETETIDDMIITLKGKGYGLYGQMIEKYKKGSIKELMEGKVMKIRTSSADDNNSSYNGQNKSILLFYNVKGELALILMFLP